MTAHQESAKLLNNVLDRLASQGNIDCVSTTNGKSLILKVTGDELSRLNSLLNSNGIKTLELTHGIRIKSESMQEFDEITSKYVKPLKSAAVNAHAQPEPNPAPSLTANEASLGKEASRFISQGNLQYLQTNKGDVPIFRGSQQGLKKINELLNNQGIETVLEKEGSVFGAGVRIKSDSIESFNQVMDKYIKDTSTGHNKSQQEHQSEKPALAPETPKVEEKGFFGSLAEKLGLVGKKLSVAGAASSPLAAVAEFKEGNEKIAAFVEKGTISQQAATEYAEMYAVVKLKQNATFGVDQSIGYDDFRKWADKNFIQSELLPELDPTSVSAAKKKTGLPQRLPGEGGIRLDAQNEQQQNNQQFAETNPNKHLPNIRGGGNVGIA